MPRRHGLADSWSSRPDRPMALSFPGGNSPFPRALLRGLLPAALPGKDFNSLMYGAVDFAALDQ